LKFGHWTFMRKCCYLDTGDRVNVTGGPSRVTMYANEAAAYLGISYWLLLELVKRGKLRPIKAGGRYLFRESSLIAWMDSQERGAVEDEVPKLRRAK